MFITSSIHSKATKELILFGPNIGQAAQPVTVRLGLLQLEGVTGVRIEPGVITLQSSYVTLGCELRAQVETLLAGE